MCQENYEIFSCGHEKRWWRYCHRATQEQRRLQQSCTGMHYRRPDAKHRSICCSTKCCQIDLDGKSQVVEERENYFNMFPGKTTSTALIEARGALISAASTHCLRCLAFWDGRNISNVYRLERNEPLLDPRPPRIPLCPGIYASDIRDFLAQIARWKRNAYVIKDRELFNQQLQSEAELLEQAVLPGRSSHDPSSEILCEYQLIEIYMVFSDMLWKDKFTDHTIGNFTHLQRLQDHMGAVQPAGE